MTKRKKKTTYDESAIRHLEGIEAIRLRVGMFLGDNGAGGLHHALWEVVDNGIDEHLAGRCSRIVITIDPKKNVARVQDDGCGIPVGLDTTGRPAIETVFTKLHAGGKFDSQAYSLSGGLHGVGVTATNATADRTVVTVCRDKKKYQIRFSRGKVTQELKVLGPVPKNQTGTVVSFHPDPKIFKKHRFDPKRIRDHLIAKAYLVPELKIVLKVILANGKMTSENLTAPDGIAGLLRDQSAKTDTPVFDTPFVFSGTPDGAHHAWDVAIWWVNGRDDGEVFTSYVNMIPVKDGGTHITGARAAITKELTRLADHRKSRTKFKASGTDLRDGLRCVIHVKLSDPQFQGQTKEKLNNPEARGMANSLFSQHLRAYFGKNPKVVTALLERAESLAKAREAYRASRALADVTVSGGTTRGRLPARLVTALRCSATEREIYLVEGDSAGGTAIQGRNARTQEILKLKGKPPNPLNAKHSNDLAKLLANESIRDIILSIGAGNDIGVPGEACRPTKSRAGKIILLMDADDDGSHIMCLLMALFLRFMRPLVEAGLIYAALPPLYVAAGPKKRVFADTLAEVEAAAISAKISNPLISRFKGLGEMNAIQLRDTVLDPQTRRLLPLRLTDDSFQSVLDLMTSSDSSVRKRVLGLATTITS